MPKRPKPPLHGRDHAPDGADPIPGIVTDGGDGGGTGGGSLGVYIIATQESQSVAAGTTDHLDFFSIFTPGSSIGSGTDITIATPGTYEVHAVGTVTYGDTDIQAQVIPEVNGGTSSIGSVTDFSQFSVFDSGTSTTSVLNWAVTFPLLFFATFAAGDVLKFQAVNGGASSLEFHTWKVLVRQLG